jgi:uncharacterized damage-inducible protein DinB
MDEKSTLTRYLQRERDALLWKLDGLTERQLRMPATPTGTNLLGLLRHVATVDVGYFGEACGRPFSDPLMDTPDDDWTADMWATADQSADQIRDFARRAWAHSDETIAARDLDATASVPWWPEDRRTVTLHRLLVHVISETSRHAGHADILRELTDGAAGAWPTNSNLPDDSDLDWADYVAKLRRVAESFS